MDDYPDHYIKLANDFGLSKNDLKISDEGFLVRKDGKLFEYEITDYDGTTVDKYKEAMLDGLSEAWDDNYKVINKKSI